MRMNNTKNYTKKKKKFPFKKKKLKKKFKWRKNIMNQIKNTCSEGVKCKIYSHIYSHNYINQ